MSAFGLTPGGLLTRLRLRRTPPPPVVPDPDAELWQIEQQTTAALLEAEWEVTVQQLLAKAGSHE